MHITPGIKKDIDLKGVLKCCSCWFTDGLVQKPVLHKYGTGWNFAQKL